MTIENRNNLNIVFESPKISQRWLIWFYLKCGYRVWVVEPFYAYHYNNGIKFYPLPLPFYIQRLINERKINLIGTKDLNPRKIYFDSVNRAVEIIEKIFPSYKKIYVEPIEYITKVLHSSGAENIFKKYLCDKIAEFYSQNFLLNKIQLIFSDKVVKVSLNMTLTDYLFFKRLLIKNKEYIAEDNIKFSYWLYILSFLNNLKINFINIFGLLIQTIGGISVIFLRRRKNPLPKKYKYGINLINPKRQLVNNRRILDFLVDDKRIRSEEVIFFIERRFKQYKDRIQRLKGKIFFLPERSWQNFSHFWQWLKLSFLCVYAWSKYPYLALSIRETHLALSEYFRWEKIFNNLELTNFITHSDFSIVHIARNILLKQKGVETWYFTDTINSLFNFQGGLHEYIRHPFWTYLYYDNFVTWHKEFAEYICAHPGSSMRKHIVGCFWAEHITEENLQCDKFIIGAFDTTYTCNGLASFEEGILFAKHIFNLVNEFVDVQIFFKEKKERSFHLKGDPVYGRELIRLYEKMEEHPRIKFYNDEADSSKIISGSHMVISFPFTSTTFEAISAKKIGLWHDPLGYYKNTLYAKLNVLVTHSYEELKSRVIQIKNKEIEWSNLINNNSGLFDPYCDRKAIERFRGLLSGV